MSKHRLYQLWDTVAKSPMGPILLGQSDAPMVRMFVDLLGDPKTMPGQHPEDFELRVLGTQDDGTGLVVAFTDPGVVMTGVQVLSLGGKDAAQP